MQYQQEQVEEFCKKYNLENQTMTDSVGPLNYHLLVNKEAKALYCYAPKV